MTMREHYIPGFEHNDNLIRRRLKTYIVSYIISNLANMLLTNIDGIILGNYVGNDALSAVNTFYPIDMMISSAIALLCAGVSSYIPAIIGKNDSEYLERAYSAISFLKKIFALVISLIQIPLIYIAIKSFGMQQNIEVMVWSYAIGIMASRPLALYNMVACDELISIGKVKVFSVVSTISALLNLIFDYLLVAVLKLGVTGAGMCTGLCIVLQFVILRVYIRKYTNLRRFTKRPCRKEAIALLRAGVSAALMQLLLGAQNWVMTWCITKSLGMLGVASMSVLSFSNNIIMAVISAVTKASSPLTGMYYSAGDHKTTDRVVAVSVQLVIAMGIVQVAVLYIFSNPIFRLFGYTEVLGVQANMLRIYSLYLFAQWIANAVTAYFDATLQYKLCTLLRTVPIFIRIAVAFAIYYWIGGITVMWAYVIPAVLYAAASSLIYEYQKQERNRKIDSENTEYMFLSLKKGEHSILPEKTEAALLERNINKGLANKIALTIEELVYITRQKGRADTSIDICIVHDGNTVLMMWDDGPPSELTSYLDVAPEEIFSAFVVRSIAKDMKCSRVYDLNYVTVEI